MVTNLIRPSYHQGYARYAGESAYPDLWKDKVGQWIPSLGITGTTLFDISGRKNNGTFVLTPTWDIGGQGQALNFNGTDEAVEVANHSDLNVGTGDFSLLVGLRDDLVDVDGHGIVSKGPGGAGGKRYLLEVVGNPQKFIAELDDNSTKTTIIATSLTVQQGQDYQLGFTADRSGNGIIYVNGVNIEEQSISASSGSLDDTSLPLRIARTTTSDTWFQGLIYYVYLYKRVLTPNEMRLFYAKPLADLQMSRPIWAVPSAQSIDNNRLALMEWCIPWEPGLPVTSVAFDQGDKQQLLWGYPDVLWGEVGPTVPDDTLAATVQLANSGGMIGAVNV